MSSIDGQPGFFTQSFDLLKEKCNSNDAVRYKDVNLMFDEMSVKKHLHFNHHENKIEGFVDLGVELNELELIKKDTEVATSALFLMAAGINGEWKLVIGYFLVNKLNANILQAVLKNCLIKLYDSGVNVL